MSSMPGADPTQTIESPAVALIDPPRAPDQGRRLESPTPRAALAVGAALIVLLLLFEALDALTPFIVGLVLVYLLAPAVDRLDGRRIGPFMLRRWLAILLLYALVLAVLIIGGAILLRPLVAQIGNFVEAFPRFVASLYATYLSLNLPDALRAAIDRLLTSILAGTGGAGLDITGLLPIARTLVSGLAAAFAFLIAPVWAFYVLKDSHQLSESFRHAIPRPWRDDSVAVLAIFEHIIGRWLRAQLLLGLVVGVATFIGLVILGELVDPIFLSFAVLLAVIAGVFELIPIIGPILSAIPTLLIALATPDPAKSAVAVAILYIGVQQVENHVLVPKVRARRSSCTRRS